MEDIKTGRVLVDFYATWCGPCKVMAKQLEQFENEVNEVKVIKINIDEDYDLAQAFGIRSIPTIIYMEDGKQVDRAIGAKNLDQLKEFTKVE